MAQQRHAQTVFVLSVLLIAGVAHCWVGGHNNKPVVTGKEHTSAYTKKGRSVAAGQSVALGLKTAVWPYFQGSASVSGGFADTYGSGRAGEFVFSRAGTSGDGIATNAGSSQSSEAGTVLWGPSGASSTAGFHGGASSPEYYANIVQSKGSEYSSSVAGDYGAFTSSVGREGAAVAPTQAALDEPLPSPTPSKTTSSSATRGSITSMPTAPTSPSLSVIQGLIRENFDQGIAGAGENILGECSRPERDCSRSGL